MRDRGDDAGPAVPGMATWYDVYRLLDDSRYLKDGGDWDTPDDRNAVAMLLGCLLDRNLAGAVAAIALYERQVPGFADDRAGRWDWAREARPEPPRPRTTGRAARRGARGRR